MPSFSVDEEDRDVAGSGDRSSENDIDEIMKDADELDADGDEDNQSTTSSASRDVEDPRPSSTTNGAASLTTPSAQRSDSPPASTLPQRPSVRPKALTAATYDIVPTIAAPQSTSINAVVATPDMRWVFSGGSDGYIRKYNWVDTVNGRATLTVAQRHPFVDSVTKAGVLLSYWENEEPQGPQSPLVGRTPLQTPDESSYISPVYSLAVQAQGLWILSGLESGGISLQSVRHEEGRQIICLRKHTSAVSVLNMAQDEKSVLSGSWDKNIHDWDLNNGQIKRSFRASAGQISAIERRPISSLPIPDDPEDQRLPNGTFSSNTDYKAEPFMSNDANDGENNTTSQDNTNMVSPTNSLFADDDSLFGDHEDLTSSRTEHGFEEDEDDDFSRAIANGIRQENEDAKAALVHSEPSPGKENHASLSEDTGFQLPNGLNDDHSPTTLTNGLPHADEEPILPSTENSESFSSESLPSSETTFLAASIDGTIRIWDRRQQDPIARILPKGSPPWCMNACWSPDGNFLYAGRRNGTVDEYSLHKGFHMAERTFKFPQGSGPVSAIKAMPNGKHLICASFDILRLYDLKAQQSKHSMVPFLIVPGHRTGVVSQLYIDPTCRFMISAGGNRGWEGASTEVMLGYEIGCE